MIKAALLIYITSLLYLFEQVGDWINYLTEGLWHGEVY